MFQIPKVFQEILIKMKPKILVTRKISDAAEEKLKNYFEVLKLKHYLNIIFFEKVILLRPLSCTENMFI